MTGGTPGAAARRYHEATKHSPESVRRSARPLDWANRPHPFKEYVGLDSQPPPPELEQLLRYGAGVVKAVRYPGGLTYHFRTYSSAGALYPVEVYAATPAGLFHFHPREHAVQRLREEDVRAALAEAAAEPGLVEAGALLVLTGILWRTAWKYRARGYRHLYWDAGTMLANLLPLADSPRLYAGFVDARVNRVLGADGEREAALALLATGRNTPAPPAKELPPLAHEVAPLSAREEGFPDAYGFHAVSSLADAGEVRAWRRPRAEEEPPWPFADPLEEVLHRRVSVRDFSSDAVPQAAVRRLLEYESAPIPADFPALCERYAIVNAVEGLEAGVYRAGRGGELDLARPGSFRRQAGYLLLEQPLGALAAATIFLMADLDRVLRELGDRGYRCAQLEAGIRAGRLQVAAFAEGLGATASTFYDDEVARFLAPGTALQPMLAVALGFDARRQRGAGL